MNRIFRFVTSMFNVGRSMFKVLFLYFGIWLLLSSSASAIIDINSNGVSDLWEKQYNSGNLYLNFNATADPDGDGWNNEQEALAGTDPLEGNPPTGFVRPEIEHIPAVYLSPEENGGEPTLASPEALRIQWPTLVGKTYTLLTSVDLSAQSWHSLGGPRIGSGSILGEEIPLTQPDGSIPPALFLRVAVGDIDIDNDNLTNAEEYAVGSSPYLADTNGNEIPDGLELAAGNSPSANTADENGDGVPDNIFYSVQFEVTEEKQYLEHVGFEVLTGTDDLHRFLTRKTSQEYSISGSPDYSDIQDGKWITTDTFLENGAFIGHGYLTTYNEGITPSDAYLAHKLPPILSPEHLESDPIQTIVTGPTIGATEIVTTTTKTRSWRVKKPVPGQPNETIVRSGTETTTDIARETLSDSVTYQQLWANYLKPSPWATSNSYFQDPGGPTFGQVIVALGEVKAAELLRDMFRKGDFSFGGTISNPSFRRIDYSPTQVHYWLTDVRLKSLRWRWVRFNPLTPFIYDYAAPPASYQKTFRLLVQQNNTTYLQPGFIPATDETIPKGIVEIECNGSEGTGWHVVAPSKYAIYKLEEPAAHATLDFTKSGESEVSFGNLPLEIAVDADRDGEITFDQKDKTTAEKPYRFWINNDQDDVEADEPVIVEENDRDLLDSEIKTSRDLEDFSRIKISVGIPLGQLQEGKFKVGLKFKNSTTNGPAIRIWPNESDTGSRDYLEDGTAAVRQRSKTCIGDTLNETAFIPNSYWLGRSDTVAHLIFEGVKKGKGELVLVVKPETSAEVESASIHLNLLDVREMYQRARIENEAEQIPDPWVNANPPAQTWRWDPWNWQYSEDPDAEDVSAIFVHGWRLTYMEFMGWSDSSYKRLWHQGFKGKFYSFRWATFSPSVFTYNDSEYRAWLCGPALATFVNQLPGTATQKKLFAHSMGNVISGKALRSGMEIRSYALCNAAMAAMAYDPDSALQTDPTTGDQLDSIFFAFEPHKTPDTDTDPAIRSSFGLKNKLNEGVLPIMFNFGLPEDSALGQWTANNLNFKPDSTGHSYYYQHVPQPPNISYKLFHAPPNANPREVSSQPEAMGYVTKSFTRTAGADLRTDGSISGFHDMSSWGPGASHSGFGETHSAQWRWSNQSTHHFWKMLSEKLELKQSP